MNRAETANVDLFPETLLNWAPLRRTNRRALRRRTRNNQGRMEPPVETSGIIQGSDEWFAARAGSLGSSRIYDVIVRGSRGQKLACYDTLQMQLLCERLTGVPTDSFQTYAMRRGAETEIDAVALYDFVMNTDVQPAGIIPHPKIEHAHASPDGLVGDAGLVEVKCPTTPTHIETLVSGNVPERAAAQIMWQIACSGRTWCDFVSFDPRLPESLRLFVRRVYRDDEIVAAMEDQVSAFLDELDRRLKLLTELSLAAPYCRARIRYESAMASKAAVAARGLPIRRALTEKERLI